MTDQQTIEPDGTREAPSKCERATKATVAQTPPPHGSKAGSIAALLKEYLHRETMYELVPSDVTDKVADQRFPDHCEIMEDLERCTPSNLDEGADLLLFARHSLMRHIGLKMDRLDEDPDCPIFRVIASVETLLREIVLAEPAPAQREATVGGNATETNTRTQAELDEMAREEDKELLRILDEWEVQRGKYIADIGDRIDSAREIEALQGRIVGRQPYSFLGARRLLRLVHEILSVRDVDPDTVLANGPASAAIAQVIAALDEDHGGALDRRDTW